MNTTKPERKRKSQGVSYEEWERRTNAVILHLTGGMLSADDLPDFGYRDAYDDDATPGATAREALSAAGGF